MPIGASTQHKIDIALRLYMVYLLRREDYFSGIQGHILCDYVNPVILKLASPLSN